MPRTNEPAETPLGNGVYVSINGGVIILRTVGGSVVPLEAETLSNLMEWLSGLRTAVKEHGVHALD